MHQNEYLWSKGLKMHKRTHACTHKHIHHSDMVTTTSHPCGFNKIVSCTVFILGHGIAGIPHFCKKSRKLSDTVRVKSPTLNHVAIRRNIQNKTNFSYFRMLRVSKNKQNAYRKEYFLVLSSQIISLNCGTRTTSSLAAKTIDVGPKIIRKKQFFCLK